MPDQEVKLRITSDATGAIQGMERARGGLRQMESETANMMSRIKTHWLGLSAAAAGVGAAVYKAHQYMLEGAKAAQSELAFRTAAENLKVNANKMIEDLKRVTNATVDDSDLMQQAMKMMTGGMKADDVVKVAELSRMAARRMGEDVGAAFKNIGDAIETGRERQLRAYHLLTEEQGKLVNAAQAAGHEVDVLKLVLLNAAVQGETLGKVTENNVEQFQQAAAAIKQYKEELGSLLLLVTGTALKTFREMGGALGAWIYDLTHPESVGGLWETLTGGGKPLVARGTFAPPSAAGRMAESPLEKAKRELKAYEEHLKSLTSKKQGAEPLDAFKQSLDDFIRGVDEMDPAMSELDKQLSRFNARADDMFAKANKLKQPVNDIMAAVYRGREFISAADLDKRATSASEAWGKAFLEFREIQEEITNKELSEIDRRMAAEDLWARNITEKLGTSWTPELGARISAVSERAKEEILRTEARGELEAQTRRRLAEVQVAGEQYLLSRVEVTRETISLNEQLLRQYKQDLDATTDAAVRLTLADKIADLNLELQRSAYYLRQLQGTMQEGYEFGFKRYVTDTIGTDFERGEREARATADAMMRAFDDGFFKLFKGEWDSMLDVVENFADDMLRILSRRFAESAVSMILGGPGGGGISDLLGMALSFLSGIGGGGGSSTEFWGGSTPALSPNVAYAQGGGPVSAGRPYIVGEAGPELIIPNAPATVIPHGQFGNTLAITVPVSIGPEHKRLAGQIQRAVEREVARIVREYA